MQPKALLLIILIAALMAGCRKSPVNEQLDRAEALMEQRPDSALAIVEKIDGKTLRGETQARHALLLTQARHRNVIHESDDSLISIAVKYYENSDDSHHKMLSYQYMGAIKFQAGFDDDALLYVLKSYDIAANLTDTLNLSRITSLIGRIQRNAFNYQTSTDWEMKSLAFAKTIDNKQWMMASYTNIAENLFNLQRFNESLAYADSAAMLSPTPDKDILEIQYLNNNFLNRFSQSDEIYSEIIRHGFQPSTMVIASQAQRHPEYALEILDNYVQENNIDITDEADIQMAYALTYLSQGDNQKALQTLRQHIISSNELYYLMGNNPLEKAQQEHSRQILEQEKERKKESQRFSIALCVIIGLLTAVSLLYIKYLRNRHRTEQLEWEHNMYVMQNEYLSIKANLEHSESKISENLSQINALTAQVEDLRKLSYQAFINQFSWVERVGARYLKSSDTMKADKKEFNKLISKELTSMLSKNQFINQLTELITQYDNKLMIAIDSLPLIDSERETLICLICGLSPAVIAVLLEKSTRAIYNLKARIKEKLSALQTPASGHILEII
ncbi:MAG: hypothetical protein K2K82_07865 [Muribaculaceae bacterium]|nr:hypothetical protein [Muribaculaceae bacterium]